jgi:magnesium-transporting ATPase (P-type)
VAAIAAFRQAGIRVKMITGDHPGTAIAIGREMGIGDGSRAVTGAELEAADDNFASIEHAVEQGRTIYDNLFNCRSLTESSLRPRLWFTNPAAWLSVGLLIVLQGLFVYVPVMNLWFHTAPLAAREWLLPIGVGLAIFLLVEVEKALARWLAPSAQPTARFITRPPGTGAGEATNRHELNYLKASHPQ